MPDFIVDLLKNFGDSAALGAIGIPLVLFLIANIRGLLQDVSEFMEQFKVVASKFRNDPDVQKLIEMADEILERLAKVARRFQARKLAKRLSDLIKI